MKNFSKAALSAIEETSEDSIIVHDQNGIITSWNSSASRIFGYIDSEVIGSPASILIPPDRQEEECRNHARLTGGEKISRFETILLAKNGRRVHAAVTLTPIFDDTGKISGAVRIARDISGEIRQKHEVSRLMHLHTSLNSISQAILRSRNREDIFRDVCTILVDVGGLRDAQILMHDEKTKQLVPVARAGISADMQKGDSYPNVYSDDRPGGRGPAGRSFRSGQPVICNDIFSDPTTRHLWEVARQFGVRSLADFPISLDGVPVGLLIVNSSEEGFFQEPVISLLSKAAGDLCFAMEMISKEEARHLAEIEVRAEKSFGDAMINAMPGIVYFYDTEGHFVRWNRNFESVSEYSGREIGKMHPLDFFPEDEKSLVSARISEVFEKGEASVEANFLTKSGICIPHHLTGRRVEMGGREYLIGVGIDVSARKMAEEASRQSEQRYRALFQHAPDGILIGTRDAFLDANDSLCQMLGLTRDQIVGRRASDFVAESELSRLTAAFEKFDSDANYREQWQLQRSDGSEFPADVIVARLPDGDVVAMARDVSEREAAADALRDLNRTLEERVKDRTRDLAEALVTATKADRIKSAFLANMSHELRTPLNSIIGFTGIILQGLAGPLNAEQHKQLDMVRNSARHLLDLINDVLDISKIEAGQLTVRHVPFDLGACIRRATDPIRLTAEKKGLDLVIDADGIPAIMVADQRRVEQILINLLSNAVKFTERGSVTLKAETVSDFRGPGAEQPCKAVRFTVEDTGVGIGAEDLKTLFQPFRQLESGLSRNHDGTGLGLAICRRLAQLLNGEVSATSIEGKGSAFTATIPLGEVVTP